MEENKIKIILDKKAVVLGDISLEITDQIIATLNKEVSSIKIN
jgi:Skp family chaperone for outer membrane proteins